MTGVLQKIRSRGYWRVNVRPTDFQKDLIPRLSDVESVFRDAHVEIRGWDYPHDPQEGPTRGDDYIEAQVSWEHYHELWRLYQSGQFIHFFAMHEDWYKDSRLASFAVEPGTYLDLTSTLYTITEIFLFASRLAERCALGPSVTVSYGLIGIAGRHLQSTDPRRMPLSSVRRASEGLKEFRRDPAFSPAELIANALEIAVDQTLEIYQRFNWDPARERVVEDQRRFIERRF